MSGAESSEYGLVDLTNPDRVAEAKCDRAWKEGVFPESHSFIGRLVDGVIAELEKGESDSGAYLDLDALHTSHRLSIKDKDGNEMPFRFN